MNKHGKKIAGAVISAGAIILYYVIFFGIIMSEVESPVVKILLGAGPALIAATCGPYFRPGICLSAKDRRDKRRRRR